MNKKERTSIHCPW